MDAVETRILLADDHDIVRAGIVALLKSQPGFVVVGEARDGVTAVRLAKELRPQVVVMDVRMPELDGIEAAKQMLAAQPTLRVIGLSASSDERTAREMIQAGASGYVVKDAVFEELTKAIHSVLNNTVYLSAALKGVVTARPSRGGSPLRESVFRLLSAREREVLQLLASGKATKEVAAALSVSVKTAESHRRNLMDKLQIDNIAELTKYAVNEGITQL